MKDHFHSSLPDPVAEQMVTLSVDRDRPLILCDADEVLVTFVSALEQYLNQKDMILKMDSFAITGNVRRRSDDSALSPKEVSAEIDNFFAEGMHFQTAVDGAADALGRLSDKATILILTNVPLGQRQDRQNRLTGFGLDYPVIANQGMKGPAVASFASYVNAPVFFLDDLPPNHSSVKEAAPDVHRLHFMADDRLRKLIPQADFASAFFENWADIHSHIDSHIESWTRAD